MEINLTLALGFIENEIVGRRVGFYVCFWKGSYHYTFMSFWRVGSGYFGMVIVLLSGL